MFFATGLGIVKSPSWLSRSAVVLSGDVPPSDVPLTGACMVTDEYRTMNRTINGKVDSMVNVRCEDDCEKCVKCGSYKLVGS